MALNPYQSPTEQSAAPRRVKGRFGKSYLLALTGIWASFTVLTYLATQAGIDRGSDHDRLVALTTCCSFLGPMTGAMSRNWQGCCLANSLGLLPYCGALLGVGMVPQFLPSSLRGVRAIRMSLWIMGWFGWFAGGPISLLHALN